MHDAPDAAADEACEAAACEACEHTLLSSPSKHSTMVVYGLPLSVWDVFWTALTSLDARRCLMWDIVGVGRTRLLEIARELEVDNACVDVP